MSIAQAIIAMLRLRAFALSVLGDDGSPIGILSEGDLKEHLELDIEKRRPRWLEFLFRGNKRAIVQLRVDGRSFLEIRTHGVSTSVEIACLRAAIDLMKRNGIRKAPVRIGRRVVGILRGGNLFELWSIIVVVSAPDHPADQAEVRGSILAMLDPRVHLPMR